MKPPSSLQNWRVGFAVASIFPSKLAVEEVGFLHLPFKTGCLTELIPPSSLQNWPEMPSLASIFPSKLAL